MEYAALLITVKQIPQQSRSAVVALLQFLRESGAWAGCGASEPRLLAIERWHLLAGGHGHALSIAERVGWVAGHGGKRPGYLLTAEGLTVAVVSYRNEQADYSPVTPFYDVELRVLSVAGVRLHYFAQQAVNLRRLLTAWQEDNWVSWLANPLSDKSAKSAAKHLKDAVSGLNRCQQPRLLHFHYESRDDGEGARWEWLA